MSTRPLHAPDQPLGTPLRDGERRGIHFERRLRHAPELVWRAITEREHLAAWLPVDMIGERRAGAALDMPFWPAVVERFGIPDPMTHGEITVWDPITTFEWNWDGDVIRFELAPGDDGGTVLTLVTWFGPAPVEPWDAAAGWHTCLDLLAQLLDTGAAPGPAGADPDPQLEPYRLAFEA